MCGKPIARVGAYLLAACLLLAALPPLRSAAVDPGGADYDGYLVVLCGDAAVPFSDCGPLEYVFGDVYWTESPEYAQELLRAGAASYVEPNYIATLFGGAGDADDGWQYAAVCAAYAAEYGLDGSGVRVGLIDSGLDPDNPDLQGARILAGYDFLEETARMSDGLYHGTYVAQVIAADQNGSGSTGIARGVELVPLRCFDDSGNGASTAVLARAIYAAVDDYHCDILNMSWGLAHPTSVLYDAIRYAADAGVILVAAAGNAGASSPQGTIYYPAYYEEVVSVSSLSAELAPLNSSQRNDGVTVCAPGEAIPFVDALGCELDASGTSFAAPCVTAELALVLQAAPGLTGDDVMCLLRERCLDLGAEGYDSACGWGYPRLDVLLGACWGRVTSQEDGAALGIEGWVLAAGGMAMLAFYSGSGRFLDAERLDADCSFAGVLSVPRDAADAVLFFLDRDLRPVGDKIALHLEE